MLLEVAFIALTAASDTGRVQRSVVELPPSRFEMVADTPVAITPHAVSHSDAYYTRLKIHKLASWLMLPVFGAQYITGTQLYSKSSEAPDWAIKLHGPLATTTAALFGVNTITGVWNLVESRKDSENRGIRIAHSVLMLAADGGFTTAGLLANGAETSSSTRSLHRTIALSSMGVAAASYLMMLLPLRSEE